MTTVEVASHIQHTNVNPGATQADIERLLQECLEFGFDGAMVNPIWIPTAVSRLAGTGVKVCTALDFPMGGGTTESVASAAAAAVDAGAEQIDIMTKVGWLKSGLEFEYRDHLATVVESVPGYPVKAMLEVALLGRELLPRAVELCIDAGIAYLKNSSGYGGGSADVAVVESLTKLAGGRVAVKASGGIKTMDQAVALLAAGAELLGASASVGIVTSGSGQGSY